MSASHFELGQMIPVKHPTKPNPLPIFIEGGKRSQNYRDTKDIFNREEILIEYDHEDDW